MKFKVSEPEDFPDVEGYEFKVIQAYSKTYSELFIILVKIESSIDFLKSDDPLLREIAIKSLSNIIDQYKLKASD